MNTTTLLAPVAPPERIAAMDVLRGFALLGIFLMNIEWFGGRPLVTMQLGLDANLRGIDHVVGWIIYTFVQGKFWTLFSLLFGMGFAVMLTQAERAGRSFVVPYLRRTLGLLGIGLAHALLIWSGDILFSYAIAAFALLLFFRKMPVPRLWKWGVGLYAGLFALVLIVSLGAQLIPAAAVPDAAERAELQKEVAELTQASTAEAQAYGQGTYADAAAERVKYFVKHALPMSLVFAPLAIGMFLIGAWLLRSGAIVEPAIHLSLFRRLAWIGLPIGLTLAVLSAAMQPSFDATSGSRGIAALSLMMLANLPVCLGYASVIVLLLQRPAWASRLAWLAPAGRMALTNYLLQSLISTLLFHGYGLGLWGQLSRLDQVLVVLVVFALQVVVSRWWLARFRYGPMEWLWRGFTYLKLPALRQSAAAQTA